MPDKDPWEQGGGKEPWEKFAESRPPSRAHPQLSATSTPIADEARSQLKRFGQGLGQTAKTAGQLLGNFPAITPQESKAEMEAVNKLGHGAWETVAGPGRALLGQSQSGLPDDAPTFWERVPAAVSAFGGGDPDKMHREWAKGNLGTGLAAGFTVPLLTYGLGKALGILGGKALPSEGTRLDALARATKKIKTPTGEGAVATIRDTMPLLDQELKASGGKPPELLSGYRDLAKQTLDSTKKIYSDRMNQPVAATSGPTRFGDMVTVPSSVSKAIKDLITPDLAKTARGQKIANYLRESAAEWEQPWTYFELNHARERLFKPSKDTITERISLKNEARAMADNVAKKAVRDLIYTNMDKELGLAPGTTAALQRNSAKLIDLHDMLKERFKEAESKEHIGAGAEMLESGASIYSSGTIVPTKLGVAYHRMQRVVTGEELAQANRKVNRAFTPKPRLGKAKRAGIQRAIGELGTPRAEDSEE